MTDKPRPIEFMFRGYSVPEMLEILARWDNLSDVEKAEIGFIDLSPSRCLASNERSRLN